MKRIETVIFDLGKVLINWDPKKVYRTIFKTEAQADKFVAEICTLEWNEEQDAGRSIAEANRTLTEKYPLYQSEIEAYYGRWTEMLGGEITGTVDILKELKASRKYRLYALTNCSAETFPEILKRYEFLQYFKEILVSGKEGMKKPSPAIYELTLSRFGIDPATAIFIDDSPKNVVAAEAVGIQSIHFKSAEQLRQDLTNLGVLRKRNNYPTTTPT